MCTSDEPKAVGAIIGERVRARRELDARTAATATTASGTNDTKRDAR
ncbi:hypothetical protein PTQ19_11900 [Microbacterium esteraromaticum]|nr:hypothetical protein [Microbacterium esteraromaticum]WDH78214.1 hypothetical protein PTQ19_11900 [Microbacterium esteraromaticum]